MSEPAIHLIQGDNRIALRRMIDAGKHVHAVVTDPPYGIESIAKRFGKKESAAARTEGNDGSFSRLSGGFMGEDWDNTGIEKDPEFWRLIHDVLYPGGYCFAFSGARHGHLQATAMQQAGFIMHPMHAWIYATGFPKAHDLSSAIEKIAPDQAENWKGWKYGTQARKPAMEPIYLAQRPLSEKTYAKNVLRHNVGALNIDGCRVPSPDQDEDRYPANVLVQDDPNAVTSFPDGAHRFFTSIGECERDQIHFSPKANKKDRDGSTHPTVKPINLIRDLVRHVTPQNGLVLDPFAGSGTTGEACLAEGLSCVLMEAHPEYCSFLETRFFNKKVKDALHILGE